MVIKDAEMSYTSKQMKSDLWDVVYKAHEAKVSNKITNAIIDVMILMDKEQEKQKENES